MGTNPWELLGRRLEGQVVDNTYHLLRFLGAGAYGIVFLAAEVVSDRELQRVAVKLIPPDPSNQERQMRELEAAARVSHPNLLRYFKSGQCLVDRISFLYLVTELAEESLERRLTRGGMTPEEARVLVEDVAAALRYLHDPRNPRVHRDLKPANVLRVVSAETDGRQRSTWKLSDFGQVQELGLRSVAQVSRQLGTPAYAPPEAWRGLQVSTAWDVWSLGIMVMEALTQRRPFEGATEEELIAAVLGREPVIPTNVPSPFDQIVRGCLIKDRNARWTAAQVLEALRPPERASGLVEPARPRPMVRLWTWLALVALFLFAAVAVYLWTARSQVSPPGLSPGSRGGTAEVAPPEGMHTKSPVQNSGATEERPSTLQESPSEASPHRRLTVEPRYNLVVSAGGALIDRNESISAADSRVKTLGFIVFYEGPSPRPDDVRVEWWVGADRWSFFDFPAGTQPLGLREQYDNKAVPGAYEVRLIINGRLVQAVPFKITPD